VTSVTNPIGTTVTILKQGSGSNGVLGSTPNAAKKGIPVATPNVTNTGNPAVTLNGTSSPNPTKASPAAPYGIGHSANGLPIGSPGSGPGSPELPHNTPTLQK
jgi:hypothetical protein